jgi:hypothetical protein
MFTEYAQVRPAQYPLYYQYEGMEVGADSMKMAQEIFAKCSGDERVLILHSNLWDLKFRQNYVPVECNAFAIRNATDTDLFDVYLMDEDSQYLNSREGVMQHDVVLVAESLMSEVHAWEHYPEV